MILVIIQASISGCLAPGSPIPFSKLRTMKPWPLGVAVLNQDVKVSIWLVSGVIRQFLKIGRPCVGVRTIKSPNIWGSLSFRIFGNFHNALLLC